MQTNFAINFKKNEIIDESLGAITNNGCNVCFRIFENEKKKKNNERQFEFYGLIIIICLCIGYRLSTPFV